MGSHTSLWRPPQWNQPLLTSITAKVQEQSVGAPGVDVPLFPAREGEAQSVTYYFDAVMGLDHEQELRTTEQPVQNNAAIVDHSYLMPANLSLEIGMSDVMDRYSEGLYTSDSSKSVSAYQKFLELQASKAPLTVKTRLKTYENMVVANVRATDDNRSIHGLRATIRFRQILVATVSVRTVSARPDQSISTDQGTKQPEPVPSDLQNNLNGLKTGSN